MHPDLVSQTLLWFHKNPCTYTKPFPTATVPHHVASMRRPVASRSIHTSRRIERGGQRKVTQNAPPVLAMKFSSITAPKRASERASPGRRRSQGERGGHLNANLSKAEGRRREGGKGESVSPLRDLRRSTAPRETTCQPYDDRDRPRVVFSHADPSPHMLAIIKSPLILHASTDSIGFSRPFALPVIFFSSR